MEGNNSQHRTLKQIRESLKKSQSDIANLVGVKQQAVSHWESGKKFPTLDNAVKLADALGISLEELATSMNLIKVEDSQ